MAVKFNPFTGQLQIDEKGSGGGAQYIDGEVAVYADLSLDAGVAPLNTAWLVRGSSGVWPFTKPGGVYVRTATGGSSRDADYTYAGIFPDVFSDANFTLYDDSNTSKNAKFQLSDISTNTTRTLTVPNASGRIQVEGQPIGNTTPSTGAFTTLSASGAITAAAGTAGTPTTPATALGVQWSGLGGTDIAAVYGTYSGAGKVGIGVGTSGILTEVASFALGGIALNRATTVSNGTLTASAPALTVSQTWNNSGVTFSALDINVTNTASLGDSALIKATIGGTTVFQFRRDYRLLLSPSGSDALIQAGGVDWIVGRYNGTTSIAAPTIRFNTGNSTILEVGTADTIEMRRTTNPQTFRLYNTFTDASNYERGFMRWSSNVLQIGTEKAGTGSARALEFQTDGVTRASITAGGTLWAQNAFAAGTISGNPALRLTANADGVIQFANNAGTDFGRLQFGGQTSSFPALKRSSTALQVRLADDSGYTVLDAQLRAQGTAPATSGATGTAGDIRYDADYIYVCTAANTWKRAAIATW